LRDFHWTGSNGFLQAFRFGEVNVSETLALVDFDLFNGAERGQRGFNKRLGYALGWISVFEEGLTACARGC
jgi:hypothetical protein